MKSRMTGTLALATLMASAAGGAYAAEGWYARADVGYSLDGEFDIRNDGVRNYGSPALEDQWSEHLGLGYAFSNGLRLEGELGHRWNEIETTPFMDAGGDIHAWSGMLNLFYDFNKGGVIEPYIGLGVGGAQIVANGRDSAPTVASFDDEDTVVAYQAMVGAAINLTDRLDLDIGYRYFTAPDVSFVSNQTAPVEREADYEHQAMTLGLRFDLQADAPPPPPPPPPAPERG